jgi:NAD(P)-dependent dehydrogenase (short-subunit alcohol dehydrogenase family)
MRLEGKVALITGGGSGIGRATALTFAAEGAKVMIADVNEETARRVVNEIEDKGEQAAFVRADTSSEADVQAAIQAAVSAFGRLDIMYNNAGIGGRDPDNGQERWDRTIAVNLSGVYYGCKYAAEEMLKTGGGSIINTASIAGLGGGYGPSYTAAKHGVVGLTREFALLHAANNIRVNCVCPGPIRTELTRATWEDEERRQEWPSRVPMGRWGEAEEIARAVLFLASDDASYITGTPLIVDGGFMAR